jgi:hypothetical protein
MLLELAIWKSKITKQFSQNTSDMRNFNGYHNCSEYFIFPLADGNDGQKINDLCKYLPSIVCSRHDWGETQYPGRLITPCRHHHLRQ